MEKLILKTIVILGLMFSYQVIAQTYQSCTDGGGCNVYNPNPGNASSGNLGAYVPGWSPGGGMGGGPSAADMAARAKAEQDQKRKYCKDNGYPANVPFCPAFKEDAIKSCEKGVTDMYRLEVADAQKIFSATRGDCYSTYASPEFLASRDVCLNQAKSFYDGAVDRSWNDRLIRTDNCSKSP